MRTRSTSRDIRCVLALLAIAVLGTIPAHVTAQSTGSIEFSAQVAPTDARPEPVRQVTFYLLNKSLASIRQEVTELYAAPDLDKFVESVTGSPELKAWMKKNKTVQLSGEAFTKSLTATDIVKVPEFLKAYMARNVGFQGVGLPKPKYKEKDRTANPEKFKQENDEYVAALSKFIGSNPDTVQGIDAELTDINPSERWLGILAGQKNRVEKRTLEVAQTSHLAAQADTNLDGRGAFSGLAPGNYWLGTLGTPAIAGDVRLRWDVPVTVRPGEVTHVKLTNLNAVQPDSGKSNTNP